MKILLLIVKEAYVMVFLKLNYAKMLQEWVKDIPQVSVNNTQIRVKNEYLQDIRLNSQEIELELY